MERADRMGNNTSVLPISRKKKKKKRNDKPCPYYHQENTVCALEIELDLSKFLFFYGTVKKTENDVLNCVLVTSSKIVLFHDNLSPSGLPKENLSLL